MREPLRDRQGFACPDCSRALEVRVHSGSIEIALSGNSKPVGAPRNRPASGNAPKYVAWAIAGVLLIGFAVFVFSGPRESGSTPPAPGEPSQDLAQLADEPEEAPVDVPKPSVPEPVDESEAVDAPEPPDEPPIIAANTTDEPPVQDAEPAAAPIQAEPIAPVVEPVDPEIELRKARDEAAIALVKQHLGTQLLAYESPEQLTLQAFLDDVSAMSATWINHAAVKGQLNADVALAVKACSVGELLTAGLKQVGATYEIHPSGIQILKVR